MALTVVIPVHNAFELLMRCLDALDSCTPPRTPVIVIDDASNDSRIRPLLRDFAENTPLAPMLLANERNLGFVGTVNQGMRIADENDVVLLNSDTEVTPGWYAAIQRALAQPHVATATPFSNHAEICSWPEFVRHNEVPEDKNRIAAAFATLQPSYPELPTAVGFCMGIARSALNEIGDFDVATFGRGYGEENDFCCRARGHGWKNVLVDDAYVVHAGGGSFAPLGLAPGGENLRRLLARYPNYARDVEAFIAADPLRELRQAATQRLHNAVQHPAQSPV